MILLRADPQGNAYLVYGNGTYTRVPWYQTTTFHRWLFVVFGAFFVLAAAWPAMHLLTACRRGPRIWPRLTAIGADRWVVAATCAVNAAFLAGSALVARRLLSGELMYRVPRRAVALLGLPLLSCALAALIVARVTWMWMTPSSAHPIERIAYTLFAAVAIAFCLFLRYWNLLGFNY
jgi:hypothetical protein